ncbi:uncharacterized protein [Paramisgurnus dabryanus]|uniref:uncharacterized protein isoform X1 n=2 Tax=Paramisgurnus dabryanus TaxID=90735 RepID=UPI0031F42F61
MNRNMENFSTLFAVVSGVSGVYLCYSLYTSHTLFQTNTVFDGRKALPGSVYLMIRYIHQSLRKKRGQVRKINDTNHELVFTLINCRYDVVSLRKFCSLVGYGWDYPDSVFRDVPLCYPQFLFRRLISMIVCSDKFRLSPQGLLSVRQKVIVPEAVDELKKGPFMLQAQILEYRAVNAGVEVDLSLKASRDQQLIWSSTLTLLSPNGTYKPHAHPDTEGTHDLTSLRSINCAVPWITGVKCAWVFGDFCSLSASLLGFTRLTVPSLWMFARCMAEIEKQKGVEVVRAPLTVSVQYMKPLSLPNQVTIIFSDITDTEPSTTSAFSLVDNRTRNLYISGKIRRQST